MSWLRLGSSSGQGSLPSATINAGTFGPSGINGIPTGLRYTSLSRAENQLIDSPNFQPFQQEADGFAIPCGDAIPQFDDHLRDITVPVLYVGAAGGEGSEGLYTLTLLGSKDVSDHIVSFYPPDQYALDYAHIDLYDADNAKYVVWSKILAWLRNHARDNSCSQ